MFIYIFFHHISFFLWPLNICPITHSVWLSYVIFFCSKFLKSLLLFDVIVLVFDNNFLSDFIYKLCCPFRKSLKRCVCIFTSILPVNHYIRICVNYILVFAKATKFAKYYKRKMELCQYNHISPNPPFWCAYFRIC